MVLPRRTLRGGLSVKRVWLLWCLGACGLPAQNEELFTGARAPRLVLQGDCAPSSVSSELTVTSFQSQCVVSLSAPRLVDEEAEFDALFDANCEKPSVDFVANRVLVVPARGAREWFVFTNFVNVRSDALEVGLVIRPQGAPPPDTLVVLPRNPGPVELRWCRSVCVENCDVPLP